MLSVRRILLHRSEERWNRPFESCHQALGPVCVDSDALAKFEGCIEAVEGNHALRPLHRRSQCQPYPSNNAVRTPGVKNIVNRLALVEDHARLGLHGHYFEGAHRIEVAQATVRHRADSSRSPAQKPADRRLDDRRWIAAEFPAHLARLRLQHAQSHARLADRDSIRTDRFDPVHPRQVQHDAAMQRNSLPVISGSRSANGYWNVFDLAVAQHFLNLIGIQRLHDEVCDLTVKLLAQYGRVPVEVTRQPFDHLRMRENPRLVAEYGNQRADVIWTHIEDFGSYLPGRELSLRLLQLRKAFCIFGCVNSELKRSRRTGPSTRHFISDRRAISFAGT